MPNILCCHIIHHLYRTTGHQHLQGERAQDDDGGQGRRGQGAQAPVVRTRESLKKSQCLKIKQTLI